jgi:hypothetical protein
MQVFFYHQAYVRQIKGVGLPEILHHQKPVTAVNDRLLSTSVLKTVDVSQAVPPCALVIFIEQFDESILLNHLFEHIFITSLSSDFRFVLH